MGITSVVSSKLYYITHLEWSVLLQNECVQEIFVGGVRYRVDSSHERNLCSFHNNAQWGWALFDQPFYGSQLLYYREIELMNGVLHVCFNLVTFMSMFRYHKSLSPVYAPIANWNSQCPTSLCTLEGSTWNGQASLSSVTQVGH